jgi:hypothetical protein
MRDAGVRAPMPNRALLHALPAVALALVLAACGGSAAPSSTPATGQAGGTPDTGGQSAGSQPSPEASPAAPDPDSIDHATGPLDVVLRVTETGGFVIMDYAMARVPLFTLYGDGRVIVVPDPFAKAAPGDPNAPLQIRETRLAEPEIQALLRYALTEGGLGLAKARYDALVMDLPTTIIQLTAADATKTVEIGGLAAEPQPGPDAPALTALAGLVTQLRAISTSVAYEPGRTMAVLAETEPAQGVARLAWPWEDLAPADFPQPVDGDPIPFPAHLLSEAQADAAAVETGGPSATLTLDGPDGKAYIVVLRPALPEEIAAG